jgi:hypothetical protein
MKNSYERRKDTVPAYWVDIYGVLKEVNWIRKPDIKHRPLTWADRPINKDRLKELWVQSEGKPLAFARLVEKEHSIQEWEVEDE